MEGKKCVCGHLESDHPKVNAEESSGVGRKNIMENMQPVYRCKVKNCPCENFEERGS